MKTAAFAFPAWLLLLAASGCSTPVPFSLGQSIPMGRYSLRVAYAEATASGPGDQYLAAQFRVEGIDSRDAMQRFAAAFLGQIRIADGAGKEYPAVPMLLETYRSMRAGQMRDLRAMQDLLGSPRSADLTNWVAVAKVPLRSRDFSVLVWNPDQRQGQPLAARIALGR
jgi:hypothetical protein